MQQRVSSKPMLSLETFFAGAFPENCEGSACTVDVRTPVTLRLLFVHHKSHDRLAVGAELVS